MRKYKFFLIALVFIVSVTFSIFSYENVNANGTYGKLQNGDAVYIEQVIEGNAFLVSKDNQQFLVKIVGIDTEGYNETIEILESFILSKKVYFTIADNIDQSDSRWNLGTLNYEGVDVGAFILEAGLGKVDNNTISYSDYTYGYDRNEQYAKDRGYYIWEDEYSDYVVILNAININTATQRELIENLDISSTLARNIHNYRKENPINHSLELKFVKGITREIYDDIKSKFVVTTNINTASIHELNTLTGISESDAREIERKRQESPITRSKFKNMNFIKDSEYEEIADFIYFEGNRSTIVAVYPKEVIININTASVDQIKTTGIRTSTARSINKHMTRNDYVYHNFKELQNLSDVTSAFSNSNNFKYFDNITFVTNINSASKNEIASLYGDFAEEYEKEIERIILNRPFNNYNDLLKYFPEDVHNVIKNVVVFEDSEQNYININTATKYQLMDLGIDEDDAYSISKQSDIKKYDRIRRDISKYSKNITLFTNVNEASENELKRLHNDFYGIILNKFIEYRDLQYFGSIEEVELFFIDIEQEKIFKEIEDYITVK